MKHEEKAAQLFCLGSDEPHLNAVLEPFWEFGLGGILLFRHHTQGFSTAYELKAYLEDLQHQFKGSGLSLISIDQEGGQVERLPHWLFPSGVNVQSLGQLPIETCLEIQSEMALRLKWLGINTNFSPVVDLNRAHNNPIIGVRAFGDDPETVTQYAQAVLKAHRYAGVLAVAKHFPGHGSGTVDSHLALPFFENWQEDELIPYTELMTEKLPAILVAHGLYPQLALKWGGDPGIPASLNPAILTTGLRQELGFNGLIVSDDMMMKAVWGEEDPVEVALKALHAGVDMLIYRRPQPEALEVFETLVKRLRQGKEDENAIDEKVARVLAARNKTQKTPAQSVSEEAWSKDKIKETALRWAKTTLIEKHHEIPSPLPLDHKSSWGLVFPDFQDLVHYSPDLASGRDVEGWCIKQGLNPTWVKRYRLSGETAETDLTEQAAYVDTIVFVAFNAWQHTPQTQLYEKLKRTQPQARFILASGGYHNDNEILSHPWVHVLLPSLRQGALEAFSRWLTTPKQRAF